MPLTTGTLMVAESRSDYSGYRTSSATVSKWPDKFDLINDILEPGKSATFRSSLVSALRTRNLYSSIEERAPTADEFVAAAKSFPPETPVDTSPSEPVYLHHV